MPKVKSSNVDSVDWIRVAWDNRPADDRGKLHVRYLSGALYNYEPVSFQLYHDVMTAKSVGGALDRLVKKNPAIKCSRIEEASHQNEVAPESLLESFDDVIKVLEKRGLARRDQDESGNLRVVFQGEYMTVFAELLKGVKP